MQETLKSMNLRKDQQMQDALCNFFFFVLFSVFCFFISYGFGFLLCVLTLCYGPRPLLIHLGERQWEKLKAWDTSFPSSLSHCWDAGEFPLNPGRATYDERQSETVSSGMDITVGGPRRSFSTWKWAAGVGRGCPTEPAHNWRSGMGLWIQGWEQILLQREAS